ncbi:protein FAM78B isoform X3 [Rhineura floridana]|uniref:protein FAM78B isoform X3 n=1 Tax=Rhineura floridana TaxID=261503 RepID=UPI002AC83309|nr:protein FAM78B isoform X3 [Rhineura floridana]
MYVNMSSSFDAPTPAATWRFMKSGPLAVLTETTWAAQAVHQDNQGSFIHQTTLEATLTWIKIISIIQHSMDLCCHHPLDHLAQEWSSWELPDLREGRVKAISDSDGVSYPWYGNTTETVTLIGPTKRVSRFSVSMNDNFYPSVTWAVPVSDSNVPLLTRIKRDQSFTTWLVAMNMTTKEKIILQTIKWRMRVDIEVDPMQLLGKRARLVGRTQQEQPKVLSRMEPIPPNALVKPNANDAQVLMWRPKRGLPLVVIPPK